MLPPSRIWVCHGKSTPLIDDSARSADSSPAVASASRSKTVAGPKGGVPLEVALVRLVIGACPDSAVRLVASVTGSRIQCPGDALG